MPKNETRWLIELIRKQNKGTPHYIAATDDGGYTPTTNPHEAMHFETRAAAHFAKRDLPLEVNGFFYISKYIFTDRGLMPC